MGQMQKANQKLEDLLSLWRDKRGPALMPSRADLPVSALRPWLGNLALVDLSGTHAYFRLCGTGLYTRFGGEMTRRKLDSLEDGHGKETLKSCIDEVRKTFQPKRMVHVSTVEHATVTFHELCLPLAADGQTIDMVLFASYAEQIR
jgi:hypothetical protein